MLHKLPFYGSWERFVTFLAHYVSCECTLYKLLVLVVFRPAQEVRRARGVWFSLGNLRRKGSLPVENSVFKPIAVVFLITDDQECCTRMSLCQKLFFKFYFMNTFVFFILWVDISEGFHKIPSSRTLDLKWDLPKKARPNLKTQMEKRSWNNLQSQFPSRDPTFWLPARYTGSSVPPSWPAELERILLHRGLRSDSLDDSRWN